MTETSTEPVAGTVVDDATMPAEDAEPTTEARMPRWQGALIALGSLVLIYGLGLGVMTAGGAVLHAIKPTRAVDAFAALHNHWVLGVLIAIGVLWLLPPYPWTKYAVAAPATGTSGETDTGAGADAQHRAEIGRDGPSGDVPDPRLKGGTPRERT